MHRLIQGSIEHALVGPLIIGRHSQCDIIIDSPKVSRQQARVELEAGRAYLIPLSTSVHVQVNGSPANGRIELTDGDQITMPEGLIIYRFAPQDEPAVECTFMASAPHSPDPQPVEAVMEGTFLAAANPMLIQRQSTPPGPASGDSEPTPIKAPISPLPDVSLAQIACHALKSGERVGQWSIRGLHASACSHCMYQVEERRDIVLLTSPISGSIMVDRPWPATLGKVSGRAGTAESAPIVLQLPPGEPLPVLLQRVGRIPLAPALRASASLVANVAELSRAAIPVPVIDPALMWATEEGTLVPMPIRDSASTASQTAVSRVHALLVVITGLGGGREPDFRPISSEMTMWIRRFMASGPVDLTVAARDLKEMAARCERLQWPQPKARWWSFSRR